jgi:hypothetical protein
MSSSSSNSHDDCCDYVFCSSGGNSSNDDFSDADSNVCEQIETRLRIVLRDNMNKLKTQQALVEQFKEGTKESGFMHVNKMNDGLHGILLDGVAQVISKDKYFFITHISDNQYAYKYKGCGYVAMY